VRSQLTGKKARVVGAIIVTLALFGVLIELQSVQFASKKLKAFVTINESVPKANQEGTRSLTAEFITVLQSHFRKLTAEERQSEIWFVRYHGYVGGALSLLYLLYGAAGLMIATDRQLGMKLFYPVAALLIVLPFITGFLLHSQSLFAIGDERGLGCTAMTTLQSPVTVFTTALFILVPVLTAKD